MRRQFRWLVLFSAAIVITALCYAGGAWATSANALFKSKTLYMGTFDEIDVSEQFLRLTPDSESKGRMWLSRQKTQGPSDLYVQNNTWQPGASTGWHTHPGHSLIIVSVGTVTAYEGIDPDCKPHVYTKNMTFVDPGGDHIHLVRNETDAEAQTLAIQLVPAGAKTRIEVADPGNCHF